MKNENARKIRPLILVIAIQLTLYLLLRTKSLLAADQYIVVMAGIVVFETVLAFWIAKQKGNTNMLYVAAMIFAIGAAVQCLLRQVFPNIKIEMYGLATCIIGVGACYMFQKMFPKGKAPKWLPIPLAIANIVIYGLLFTVGTDMNNTGTTAWISIGGATFQLTEFIKIIACLFYAVIFADHSLTEKKKMALSTGFVIGNLLGCLAIRELGNMLVLLFLHILAYWVFMKPSKAKAAYMTICLALIASGICLLVFHPMLKEMRFDFPGSSHIYNYIDKIYTRYQMAYDLDSLDLNNEGYQMDHARQALILGGLLGTRLPISIPVADSDMVFTYVILNFGALTGFSLLVLYVLLGVNGYAATVEQNGFRQVFMFCATTLITLQALLNIAMSTGLFPLAGICLPFVSVGGTYELVCMILIIAMCAMPEARKR